MKLVILEGPRGVGKSSIGFKLRQKLNDVTLVNFTGFPLDGEEGHEKVSEYYWNWIEFLKTMKYHDSIFVCDRFFFSEAIFSELYKEYDFSGEYNLLLQHLEDLAEEVEIIFFTINDEEELKQRLVRDKIPFGKAEESVVETMKQQELYKKTFNYVSLFSQTTDNIKITTLDTTGKSIEEVEKEVFDIVQG